MKPIVTYPDFDKLDLRIGKVIKAERKEGLEPRKIMGEESHGMILATGGEKPILLKPVKKVPQGTKIH